jgi:GNAT superfamily N-acetyltransferase
MKDLPDHFTEKAVSDVEKDTIHEIVCVYENAELIGFIVFKVQVDSSEILWMAISNEYRGKKYGKSILEFFEAWMRERGVKTLIVKTLDDSANYPPYLLTTRFYRKNGFKKIHFIETNPEWGPGNPCAVYEKRLK